MEAVLYGSLSSGSGAVDPLLLLLLGLLRRPVQGVRLRQRDVQELPLPRPALEPVRPGEGVLPVPLLPIRPANTTTPPPLEGLLLLLHEGLPRSRHRPPPPRRGVPLLLLRHHSLKVQGGEGRFLLRQPPPTEDLPGGLHPQVLLRLQQVGLLHSPFPSRGEGEDGGGRVHGSWRRGGREAGRLDLERLLFLVEAPIRSSSSFHPLLDQVPQAQEPRLLLLLPPLSER